MTQLNPQQFPAGRTEGWPRQGVIPVEDFTQVEDGSSSMWHNGVWEGNVAEDDVVLYRGIGSPEELRPAMDHGRWSSAGEVNLPFEKGTTQFGADPDEIAEWDTFGGRSHVLEVNVSGLPFRSIKQPGGIDDRWHDEGVGADVGEGLGVVGDIATRRITRIGVVDQGKVASWVDGSKWRSTILGEED